MARVLSSRYQSSSVERSDGVRDIARVEGNCITEFALTQRLSGGQGRETPVLVTGEPGLREALVQRSV